jgi:hypothetical protein
MIGKFKKMPQPDKTSLGHVVIVGGLILVIVDSLQAG